jgi:hypothetical protein
VDRLDRTGFRASTSTMQAPTRWLKNWRMVGR